MDRRAFLGTLALLAVPRVIEAQPSARMARIGYLVTNLQRIAKALGVPVTKLLG